MESTFLVPWTEHTQSPGLVLICAAGIRARSLSLSADADENPHHACVSGLLWESNVIWLHLELCVN